MQTLTITTDSIDLIGEIKEAAAKLAKRYNASIRLNDKADINKEVADIKADIELFKLGKLETLSHDELNAEMDRW